MSLPITNQPTSTGAVEVIATAPEKHDLEQSMQPDLAVVEEEQKKKRREADEYCDCCYPWYYDTTNEGLFYYILCRWMLDCCTACSHACHADNSNGVDNSGACCDCGGDECDCTGCCDCGDDGCDCGDCDCGECDCSCFN